MQWQEPESLRGVVTVIELRDSPAMIVSRPATHITCCLLITRYPQRDQLVEVILDPFVPISHRDRTSTDAVQRFICSNSLVLGKCCWCFRWTTRVNDLLIIASNGWYESSDYQLVVVDCRLSTIDYLLVSSNDCLYPSLPVAPHPASTEAGARWSLTCPLWPWVYPGRCGTPKAFLVF